MYDTTYAAVVIDTVLCIAIVHLLDYTIASTEYKLLNRKNYILLVFVSQPQNIVPRTYR